ncbi:acyl carrier protein [Candidatus Poribacteria bacterium]|jgi:acyl carrier protein|nr:acyl carrier protein [Candidatus Poribacteria bacterium]MBT5536904.1 acyl carrier protein [Candidatus Poribacteria bacterium]MBT5710393.1 acyl carrier protein [Candidatus Poribacteria bacterium]MBT7101502.1 acyl carrier protein [Candidatus Poribacteria bacterium]MBT7806540.1 acyl carrier protein [Candidatus Poribacteria bacterium]
MQRADITREVLTVLADFVDDAQDIAASEDLGIDSFSRLCVLAELEDGFDVVLPEDAIQDVNTIEQLVDVFSAALAQAAALLAAAPEQAAPAMGGA